MNDENTDILHESILLTMKAMLLSSGDVEDDHAFDEELIVHINAKLFTAMQIGVGDVTPIKITGPNETWADVTTSPVVSTLKQWMYEELRPIFDAPTNSALTNALKEDADENAWRMEIYNDVNWSNLHAYYLDHGIAEDEDIDAAMGE